MLPEPVRTKVVALGAETLSLLPSADIPAPLRPVAKFAPAKRVRLASTAIAAALESDDAFRRKVFETAAKHHPTLVESLREGKAPPAADPADVAGVAYLQRPDGWEEIVGAAAQVVQQKEDDQIRSRETEAVARVQAQLDAARTEARETRDRLKGEISRLKEENSTLRRRLQTARQQLTEARDAEQTARSEAQDEVERAQAAQRSAEAEARRLRARLAEAEEAAASSRRAERGGRDLATARLSLLLDTLVDAATGLRRELALPASSLRPADSVAGVEPSAHEGRGGAGLGRDPSDPQLLDELLRLPRAHLVVDGYNVTKAAWPTMPLHAQRTRLVQSLAALAARSVSEVTCVFDGADVSAPPPVGAAGGVRVRFSPPGSNADELIKALVAAEPEGRAVVVVSSDREIAEAVRRPGVHSVESVALIGLLRS
ncbi:NYN domain-containing protein [Phytoactinopolyspora halotolerans]|uniref:RNA-binding protein n=1 Tax=Phytoactinopolyspora halotolerans TaxID=1981512 RepID=A0A6L9S9T3_9ACTN|nr:NYN domain-containing protein [Phytoactinopolyspora halotolerans]NEE01793.1 RNA-binding protein [Phytoactinopolyspora halotolerans]